MSVRNTNTKYKTTGFILSRAYINNNIISIELCTAINWISTVLFVEQLNAGDNVDVEDDRMIFNDMCHIDKKTHW